ncbi:4'-phosphopantetheinyl transferase [Streptomyces sp. NPDC059698]|uniref:4'-phosphopantetheinyl transferase family protein n=1 Tax=unclassified Streptomyces TaxID=2593676 RepID=UPI00093ECE34|nr:4'-phosphopantetheinyl transferase superfamily protein [Streptomyces sp. CB02366]OKJ28023.1 phosphopantetheinyl transferase [Streptomyces sp. CB02366]TVP35682.1 phosphopantetheinyl transferase [Streptomyces griseus subsp. griseus]WSS58883.1 4'-phosphopantetheinyl transferase superfamily protein [Streptomyces sp. NBC_01178]
MIECLLPSGVVHAEAFTDTRGVWLYPEEEAVATRWGPERRAEFATARHLARGALARLGVAPGPLLPGPDRAPRWPMGVVGSITHCAGYRAVVLAPQTVFAALGVDAEPNSPLPPKVLDRIATVEERLRLGELAADRPGVRWDRLLFSIKESVYKAWYLSARSRLGFQGIAVGLDVKDRSFVARLSDHGGGRGDCPLLLGRWSVRHGLVVTAVTRPNVPRHTQKRA